MTHSQTFAQLLAQHAMVRDLMDQCSALADALDAGYGDPQRLRHAVAQLRGVFEAHNAFEERVLRPILRDAARFADVGIARMVAAHVTEHHTMQVRLAPGSTAALRDTMASLRAHLLDEECLFASTQLVRDDLVVVESGG